MVVYFLVGALSLATVLTPAPVWAQAPEQEETAQPWSRDITPYVVGLGAIMGVIAFNIAAPPVATWGGAAVRSINNIGAVSTAARRSVLAALGRGAAPAAARAATTAVASAARPVAAAAATAARPLVPPLTQSMLAQAQIGGAAAAAVGAGLVYYSYQVLNWATGLAP
jgi:hypothetical protein